MRDATSSGAGAAPVTGFAAERVVPDASLSSDISTDMENAQKHRAYAHLRSAAADRSTWSRTPGETGRGWLDWLWRGWSPSSASAAATPPPSRSHAGKRVNVIEEVYDEDFETIDHIQAMRFPPIVAKQIKDAVRAESERRCGESEKTMARCLQDKMWTSWKCQKERDAYYHCVEDEERRNLNPRRAADDTAAASFPAAPLSGAKDMLRASSTAPVPAASDAVQNSSEEFVDLLTAYRWKFNLGVLHGELTGRNNIMRALWKEHFPDRELPHPWVKSEEE